MSILSFSCAETAALFEHGKRPRRAGWGEISKIAIRKLQMLDAAKSWHDLKVPPQNRPEHLSGNLKGYSSIRINSQWRIVFKWDGGSAHEVEIQDYH